MRSADDYLHDFLADRQVTLASLLQSLEVFAELVKNVRIQLVDLPFEPAELLEFKYRNSKKLNQIALVFSGLERLETAEQQSVLLQRLYQLKDVNIDLSMLIMRFLAQKLGLSVEELIKRIVVATNFEEYAKFMPFESPEIPVEVFELPIDNFQELALKSGFSRPIQPIRVLEKLLEFLSNNDFLLPEQGDDEGASTNDAMQQLQLSNLEFSAQEANSLSCQVDEQNDLGTIDFIREKQEFEDEIKQELNEALQCVNYKNIITDSSEINADLYELHQVEQFYNNEAAIEAAQSIIDLASQSTKKDRMSYQQVEAEINKLIGFFSQIDVKKSIINWPNCIYKGKVVDYRFLEEMVKMKTDLGMM